MRNLLVVTIFFGLFVFEQSHAAAGEQPADFQTPNGVLFRRESILSEGTAMAAEVFAPGSAEQTRLPTIVMSHGWGGTAKMLRPDAIRFAQAGYLVVAFDYRGWGNSDSRLVPVGKPEKKDGKLIVEVKEVREVVDPIDQTTDILNAINWVAGDRQCDPGRIGLWGSSFSGGHVVYVAARDPRVKAFVSQVGSMDGRWVLGPTLKKYTFDQGDVRARFHRLPKAAGKIRLTHGCTGGREVHRLCPDRGHRPMRGRRQAVHHSGERRIV